MGMEAGFPSVSHQRGQTWGEQLETVICRMGGRLVK